MADKHARTIADQGNTPESFTAWQIEAGDGWPDQYTLEVSFRNYIYRAEEHYHSGQWNEARAAATIAQAWAMRLAMGEPRIDPE